MILIADSGSTKTHWCLIDGCTVISEFFTNGINPFYQTEEEITKEIKEELFSQITDSISVIYFYGAGCSFPEKKQMVENAIANSFPKVEIEINSDLLGAARGLFGDQAGIACILGTGSNSCFYDGVNIVQNVSPLGYILGDEGSGAVLGKLFVGDLLKNQLSEDVKHRFLEEYQLTPADILDAVYKKPFPNRYLAQFTRFMSRNQKDERINKLIIGSFSAFFQRNVLQYNVNELKCSFVGSIAHFFHVQLSHAAEANQVHLGEILKSPMEGLIKYHAC